MGQLQFDCATLLSSGEGAAEPRALAASASALLLSLCVSPLLLLCGRVMNLFSFIGDLLHLTSIVIILLKIYTQKNCRGTSSRSSRREQQRSRQRGSRENEQCTETAAEFKRCTATVQPPSGPPSDLPPPQNPLTHRSIASAHPSPLASSAPTDFCCCAVHCVSSSSLSLCVQASV